MNPLTRLSNLFKPKLSHNYVGAPSFKEVNPYDYMTHYKSDAYSSAYPSVRAISNEYMTVRPYGIDANGKPTKHPAIDAMYHPNQSDSSVSFFEKIAVSTLVHRNTYILVWRNEGGVAKPGGDFGPKGQRIAGYTFLEGVTLSVRDKKTYYTLGSQEFTTDEVICLPGGVNPYSLYTGYSPTIAAKRWATLDDYIADFQKGFFENNAIPAGHFIITAASEQDYKDTVKRMQEKHRGAGNNNNVTYTPRPLDQAGKPADAKIEWIPFAQSNKEIDFKNLFEQSNKRIDMAYGASQFIKGVDDAPNYATAQVSDKNFAKRAVYPLLLRNYTQFTHELNRITGGLGVSITFKYDIPIVADEEKVEAETNAIRANTINMLVNAGYTLESVIEALELPNNFKLLKQGQTSATKIDNDKPDVDEGDEVKKSPDPTEIDGVTPLKNTPPKAPNKKPKQKRESAKKKTAKKKAELTDEEKLEKVARDYMQAQVDRAIEEYNQDPDGPVNKVKNAVEPDPTDDELDAFVAAAFVIILAILISKGEAGYASGFSLVSAAGIDTSTLQGFTLTQTAQDAYLGTLHQVGSSYGQATGDSIRGILAQSQELGLSRAETERALKEITNLDDWRVKRLARSELNRSESLGQLEGMKELAAETGLEFEKVWVTDSDPCIYCQSMDGRRVAIDQPFIPVGGSIDAKDKEGNDVTLVNNFLDIETADAHPNCQCTLIYEVIK